MLKSQSQCKANFQAINNVFSENHIPLNQELEGKHGMTVFQENKGVDPATGADQLALYTNLVGGKPVLFFRPHNSGTPIQMTADSISTVAPTTYGNNDQYTFMAGPFRIYVGRIINALNNQVKVLAPTSTILYVQTTGIYPPNFSKNPTPVIGVITGSGFTIKFKTAQNPPANLDLTYFAVGI